MKAVRGETWAAAAKCSAISFLTNQGSVLRDDAVTGCSAGRRLSGHFIRRNTMVAAPSWSIQVLPGWMCCELKDFGGDHLLQTVCPF